MRSENEGSSQKLKYKQRHECISRAININRYFQRGGRPLLKRWNCGVFVQTVFCAFSLGRKGVTTVAMIDTGNKNIRPIADSKIPCAPTADYVTAFSLYFESNKKVHAEYQATRQTT